MISCIMPVLNNWPMTEQAIYDLLGQSVPTRVIVPAQGVDAELRTHLEHLAEKFPDRVLCVFWDPALPALAAVWNRCLEMVWSLGEEEALVVNNDVRLLPQTVEFLSSVRHDTEALFVSAVGVAPEQFDQNMKLDYDSLLTTSSRGGLVGPASPGGPDFSCFLISRQGHREYPFDEHFIPAFCEDLDLHRRMMLQGDGARIFSVNVPFLHYASQTLKTMDPAKKAKVEGLINRASREYYARKWGGPVNQETFYYPFGEAKGCGYTVGSSGPTTPELQAYQRWIDPAGPSTEPADQGPLSYNG